MPLTVKEHVLARPASPARLVELDFFRGLVLLVIVVDHISGSLIAHITLHAFAVCDAAEVFVFLGGFAAAGAYVAQAARHGGLMAGRHFFVRAVEIYRAFLVTAGLMLVLSALLSHVGLSSPNLALSDLGGLARAPLHEIVQLLTFQRQPYLSAILPMYVGFAVLVPFVVPLAIRHPWLLAGGSALLWLAAAPLGTLCFGADRFQWSFNPFAWQLMFVMGVLARCKPFHARIMSNEVGHVITAFALMTVAFCAVYKLGSNLPLPEGELKRLLALPRVLNFAALAWLMAECVRQGWVKRVAARMEAVVKVGRRGLVCFVVGTTISLTLDALLRSLPGSTAPALHLEMNMLADVAAIGLLVMVAKIDASVAGWRHAGRMSAA